MPDPREEVPEIPPRLWEILQRALARDPDERYADAADLEEALRAFLFESGQRADDGGVIVQTVTVPPEGVGSSAGWSR